MSSGEFYEFKTLKAALVGWILISFFALMSAFWIMEPGDSEILYVLLLLIIPGVWLVLTSGTVIVSTPAIAIITPIGTYQIQWSDITRVDRNLMNFIFRGEGKRLVFWNYWFWGGADKDVAWDLIEKMMKKRKLSLTSSLAIPFYRKTKIPKNRIPETTAAFGYKSTILQFFLVTFGLFGLILLIHWYLFYHTRTFSVFEDSSVNYWMAFLLPPIALLPWLYRLSKRIQLINVGRLHVHLVYLWIAVSLPALFNASSVEIANANLVELDDISQIEKQKKATHYTLKNYYVDKYNIGVHHWTSERRKSRRGVDRYFLGMHIDIAVPILTGAADTAGAVCQAWLIVSYFDEIDNDLDEDIKEAAYHKFIDISQSKFDRADLSNFNYLERSYETGVGREAIKANTKYAHPNPIIFIPWNLSVESRKNRLMSASIILYLTMSAGWLIVLFQARPLKRGPE